MRMLRIAAGGEAFAAVVGFLQAVALDHRAHGAVDDQDAFFQGLEQQCGAGRVQPGEGLHGFTAVNESTSKWGGRRSRVTVSALAISSPAFSANLRSSFSEKPRLTWP